MKKDYKLLCESRSDIPIFSMPWWLDAVAGDDGWDVVIVKNGNQIVASLPFVTEKKYGIRLIKQPKLTQHLGPWIRPIDCKYPNKLSREKKLITELYVQLPQFSRYSQNWSFRYTNWVPLYWKGYKQTTRYTYRFEALDNVDTIWSGFKDNIKREIRKAKRRYGLKVVYDFSPTEFYSLVGNVFSRQNRSVPYSWNFFSNLDMKAESMQSRKIIAAVDDKEVCHAAVYVVWDKECAYYIAGGNDRQYVNSGAMSLCLWEAIRFSSTVTKSFDFEGSMIESIERYFRAFGAKQIPYHRITKTNSVLLKLYESIV